MTNLFIYTYMFSEKTVCLIIYITLFSSHLLATQVEKDIPVPDKVGAEIMPQFIAPFHDVPFNMPKLQYPKFPDYSVNIKDNGATVDKPITELVNRLIMETSRKGGGKVVIPSGKWKSARIILKSNVNLYLEKGAETLSASAGLCRCLHGEFPAVPRSQPQDDQYGIPCIVEPFSGR